MSRRDQSPEREDLHSLMHSIRRLIADFDRASEHEQLQMTLDIDVLKKTNDELSDWYRLINRRLRDCDVHLRDRNLAEAVRLAEIAPKLLDIYVDSYLSDDEREAWDEILLHNDLRRPEPLLDDIAEDLNRAYSARDSQDGVLAAELRLLVLGRAPLRDRLQVLWKLAAKDSQFRDDVVAWERKRLEEIEATAAALARSQDLANSEKVYFELMEELVASEWTSEADRRKRLIESFENAVANNRKRQKKKALIEAVQQQQSRAKDLAGRIVECYVARDAAAITIAANEWQGLPNEAREALPAEQRQQVQNALAWHDAAVEQARAATAEDLQRRMHHQRQTDWQKAVDGLRDLLANPATRFDAILHQYQRVTALGTAISTSLPEDLQKVYAERIATRKESSLVGWLPRLVPAIVAVIVLVSCTIVVGAWYFKHKDEQAWRRATGDMQTSFSELQKQSAAYVLNPARPIPEPVPLCQAIESSRSHLEEWRRLAGSESRRAELQLVANELDSAVAELEGRLSKFLAELQSNLDHADKLLSMDDLDNAKANVDDRGKQLAELAPLKPVLPKVANQLSQLSARHQELTQRLVEGYEKRALPSRLTKLATIFPEGEVRRGIENYVGALRDFVDKYESDALAESFRESIQDESLWLKAYNHDAFAVGWLRKTSVKWRCETMWRPTPGTKYSLNLVIPDGNDCKFLSIGEMQGTRPVLNSALDLPDTMIGRLIFASKHSE